MRSAPAFRGLLEDRGFSMGRTGRYAGCAKSFIHALCAGTKKTCTPQLAERIAEALDVPMGLIFVIEQSADCGQKSSQQKISA